jgi:hypothetical protein
MDIEMYTKIDDLYSELITQLKKSRSTYISIKKGTILELLALSDIYNEVKSIINGSHIQTSSYFFIYSNNSSESFEKRLLIEFLNKEIAILNENCSSNYLDDFLDRLKKFGNMIILLDHN